MRRTAYFFADPNGKKQHQLAQQSTSRRQMRWISIDLCISSTWFSMARGEEATKSTSRGAIQRSEIGSYHLPGVINLVSPLQFPPGFCALSQAPVAGVLREVAVCGVHANVLLAVAMARWPCERLCHTLQAPSLPRHEINALDAHDVPGSDLTRSWERRIASRQATSFCRSSLSARPVTLVLLLPGIGPGVDPTCPRRSRQFQIAHYALGKSERHWRRTPARTPRCPLATPRTLFLAGEHRISEVERALCSAVNKWDGMT